MSRHRTLLPQQVAWSLPNYGNLFLLNIILQRSPGLHFSCSVASEGSDRVSQPVPSSDLHGGRSSAMTHRGSMWTRLRAETPLANVDCFRNECALIFYEGSGVWPNQNRSTIVCLGRCQADLLICHRSATTSARFTFRRPCRVHDSIDSPRGLGRKCVQGWLQRGTGNALDADGPRSG